MSRYNGEQRFGYNGGHSGYNPSNDGWTHTGSNSQSKADFDQRDGVKMDYYPSTVSPFSSTTPLTAVSVRSLACAQQGTVKTSTGSP